MRAFLLALAALTSAPALAQPALQARADYGAAPSTYAATEPAPAARRALQVVVVMPAIGRAELALHDAAGRTVRTLAPRLLWAGRNRLALDVADLPAGLYRLQVKTPQGLWHRAVRVG